MGTNEATAELTEAERYVVRVTADFDRDTNAFDDQSNAYQDEELYVTSVEVSRDASVQGRHRHEAVPQGRRQHAGGHHPGYHWWVGLRM